MKDEHVLQWFGTRTGRAVLWVAAAAAVIAAILTFAVMAALAIPGEADAAAAGDPPAQQTPPPDPHAGHADAAAPAAAAGQAQPQGPPPTLDIVFDTVSDERAISAELNVPFEFSLVARHADGGVLGWEAHVVVDKRIAVLERKVEGLNMAPGEDNWQVGLGENCQKGDEIVLARYKAIVWVKDATDMVLGLTAIPRSSFTPPSPGYLTCVRQGDIRPMAAADTLAVVNPEQVHPRAPGEKPAPTTLFKPVRDRH